MGQNRAQGDTTKKKLQGSPLAKTPGGNKEGDGQGREETNFLAARWA